MKKKLLAILSGAASVLSIAFICDRILNGRDKLLGAESVQFFNKKITHREHHSHERFFRENPLAIILFIVFATLLFFNGGLQKYMQFFQTSIIQTKYTTDPFDGAVAPVEKVPKWTALTTAERSYTYSQLPSNKLMPLPKYNVADFKKGLTWTASNESERNAYITYPVPNLGNYQLDGTEGSGSHTGLDIKLPIGTPIRSISRGVVIKAESLTTGFGKHIVVMHTDVPDPKNPAKKTTLFSAYAHLSQIKVRVGSQVQKGQTIGLSGDTGMATAPHLHFQVDTAEAPFHPYWPIAWSDVVANRLGSFFEAVKNGVNKNKAIQYTVHPMDLVTKNIGYVPTNSRIVASVGRTEQEILQADPVVKTRTQTNFSVNPVSQIANRVIKIPVKKNSRTSLAFARDPAPVTNNRIRIASRSPNKSITTLHASAPKATKTASAITKNIAPVTQKVISPVIEKTEKQSEDVAVNPNFENYGSDEMWFEMDRFFVPGISQNIKLFVKDSAITDSGVTFRSNSRDFVKIDPSEAKIEAFKDGYLNIKITTSSTSPFKIIAETKKEKIESTTFLAKSFVDISSIGSDRIAAEYADKNSIITANSKGEFRPNDFMNRAEAVKSIIIASNIKLVSFKTEFNDVAKGTWFASYVTTAVENGLVSGYAGNLFKPGSSITKAEFLKIALIAEGIDPADTNFSPYRDVAAESWYEKYFSFARNNGLLSQDSKGFVYPNQTISRIEAAQILYRLSQIR